MSEGTTPTAADAVREHLRGFLAPVIAERDGLLERRDRLEAELAEVREAIRVADGVIGRIDGSVGGNRKQPGPKPKTAAEMQRTSRENLSRIRAWLDSHGDELGEFTMTSAYKAMSKNGRGPRLGKDVVRRAIHELRDQGFVSVSGRVRGGGYSYVLTRNAAGGETG